MRTNRADSARLGTRTPTAQSVDAELLASLPAFLTVPELAQVLRIGRNQAYEAVRAGQVAAYRFGGSIRVPKAAVQRLAAAASGPAVQEV